MARGRVLALGFFDGVHLGHAALLRRTREVAEGLDAKASVLSFDTHPASVISGGEVPLITDTLTRTDLIGRLFGIDDVIIMHFNEAMRHMLWADFAEKICGELGAEYLIAGYDYRFGYKGEGDTGKLLDFCRKNSLGCEIIPAVTVDGVVVSSTAVRKLLAEGQVALANRFLGHPHTLLDTVYPGYRIGRTIGKPTINMRFAPGVVVPRYGVYAAKVYIAETEWCAVTNIGVRPTVGGEDTVSVESHILDYSGELYGSLIRLEFMEFLRPEKRFPDITALKEQIEKDVLEARRYFASC